jgi:MoxR-like ATPase
MTVPPTNQAAVSRAAEQLEQTIFEVKKIIVGQDRVVERLLVCLLAKGHALLEGVPGLAKTLAAETVAVVVGGSFHRIQFTPDLLPADVMGTRIYRASTEAFDVELGPVFANFVLADEINRAPAKVQSALLEVMAEHQVSIGGQSYPVPRPFLVLATQNPIEQEGVYPLPEAQRDRFLMKIVVDYPTLAEEVEIVQRMGVKPPEPAEALTIEALGDLQQVADSIFVAREVVDYAVSLVFATRRPDQFGLADLGELVAYGASPRASLGLVAAGRALALMRGRTYVLPQDVFDVAPDILRHRLVLSYEALARDIGVDDVLGRLLSTVPAPRVAPSQDHSATITAAPPAVAQPAPAGPSWAGQGGSAAPVSWAPDGESTPATGTDGWDRTDRG